MFRKKLKKKGLKVIREAWYDAFGWAIKKLPDVPGNRGGLRILVYHGICNSDHLKFNSRFITKHLFEMHLKWVQKYFNPISLEDFKLRNFSKNKLNVMLTFDDGLKNNYKLALPLLEKYRVPAVFFVSMTDNRSDILFNDLLDVFSFMGPNVITINNINFTRRKYYIHFRYFTADGKLLSSCFHDTTQDEKKQIEEQIFTYVKREDVLKCSEYWALMSEEEIKKINQTKAMAVGSHGVSHSDFTKLNSIELSRELVESKNKLEKIINQRCENIAFPYGNYDDRILKECQKCDYKFIFGTEKIISAEDKEIVIERMTVNPFVSAINQMYYIAKNSYE